MLQEFNPLALHAQGNTLCASVPCCKNILTVSVNADKWTFDQLLQTPLPNHPAADNFGSVTQRDKDCGTHPITVQYWQGWEEDVKTRLKQADILVGNDLHLLASSDCYTITYTTCQLCLHCHK